MQYNGYEGFRTAPERVWARHQQQLLTVALLTGVRDATVTQKLIKHSIDGNFPSHDEIQDLFYKGRGDLSSGKEVLEFGNLLNKIPQSVSPFSLGYGHHTLGTKNKSQKESNVRLEETKQSQDQNQQRTQQNTQRGRSASRGKFRGGMRGRGGRGGKPNN